jgi:hypothetical protein
MSLTPPTRRSAEEFVKGAGELSMITATPTKSKTYPWEHERVREDVIKSINLRLAEPYILKLQYLAEVTNKSQQELIREVLLPAIDAHINELIEQE